MGGLGLNRTTLSVDNLLMATMHFQMRVKYMNTLCEISALLRHILSYSMEEAAVDSHSKTLPFIGGIAQSV
jgi:hypothetical protein